MERPSKIAELVPFLEEHRFALLTDLYGKDEIVRFLRADAGGLHFSGEVREHYLPIRCGAPGDRSETGIELDPEGFSITKFGRTVRVRYLAPAATEARS
jgi:hypothetical protein